MQGIYAEYNELIAFVKRSYVSQCILNALAVKDNVMLPDHSNVYIQ